MAHAGTAITAIMKNSNQPKDFVFLHFSGKKHHKIPIICINTGDTAPYQG